MGQKAKGEKLDEHTIESIGERFRQAARTAYRLPAVRVQGYVSYWPDIKATGTERSALEERRYIKFPPTPQEVDEMLEVMRWIQCLEVEQRKLVWMRARRYGWRDITIRFACDRTTAWRRWQSALRTVADQLNASCEGRAAQSISQR